VPNSVRIAQRREATRLEILDAAWAVARRSGLAALTLREVAAEVGMQAPSLYSHFPSKHAIYDAMFADAWATYLAHARQLVPHLSKEPRARLAAMARDYVAFACTDLARHQIMDVRTIPDFTPSAESYAVSVECFDLMVEELTAIGVSGDADIDIYTALLAGVVSQQLANDPGGDRWIRLVPRVIDMYADAVGIPKPRSATKAARRSAR
jgi:AcrR family transcriptional regulator